MGDLGLFWCSFWGRHVASKFHPQICGYHGWIVMYGLRPHFSVSLWGSFYGVVFCLKISDNLLIACILASSMYENGAFRSGLEVASIIYSATLVADSLLNISGILLCSGGN